MDRFQFHINAIPKSLHALGLRHAVISPGSRNAPLIMAFVRYQGITCHSATDERSAAFIALGLSKALGEPAAVICTSGSALANFYPAVLEAYYMQVPLLVISADRPSEMIDRWDGQTILQYPFFFHHIKASFNAPQYDGLDKTDEVSDLCHDFYLSSLNGVRGPSHLNVPMDEPLYLAANQEFEYPHVDEANFKQTSVLKTNEDLSVLKAALRSKKVMILIGASEQRVHLSLPGNTSNTVILCDLLSNNRHLGTIDNWESILFSVDSESFKPLIPDVLITFGKMILNKRMKQLLRMYKPEQHFHLEPNGYCADTFFTNPTIVKESPEILETISAEVSGSEYKQLWLELSRKRTLSEAGFTWESGSELGFIRECVQKLSSNVVLHLANSMTVRNVAYLAQYLDKRIYVHGNRGVSGIDGCTSTALGMAIAMPEKLHVLLTGDLAFLYDANAFLVQSIPANLKIVVMNNQGGGIFRMIDGPDKMRELDPYMTTPHNKDLSKLAELHGIGYLRVGQERNHDSEIEGFLSENTTGIMEFKSEQQFNTLIFSQFKHL